MPLNRPCHNPKEEWARLLLHSPTVVTALGAPRQEKELRRVKNAVIEVIEGTTLEEWLGLVAEHGRG